MGGALQKRLILLLLLPLLALQPLSAKDRKTEQKDSLVRLMKGTSLSLVEIDGQSYRKAVDATFLHNGTYLICDTALWDVDHKIINAFGHVQVIQDETILTSEKLDYLIDDNLAQFRGTLVQLQNKKLNTLRTRKLDYNTRDSIAVFGGGASMKDKDGQIIESMDGTYESARKLFKFRREVEMFTDSVFVKTDMLDYDSDEEKAYFRTEVDFWKDGRMLSAGSGWYDKGHELFFFTDKVHGLGDTQEVWADSLYYFRSINDLEMRGNAQIQDTSRHVAALSNYVYYTDSISRVQLSNNAAVAIFSKTEEGRDTLYIGGDTLFYRSVRHCDIPESEFSIAEARFADIMMDPVAEYRAKAAAAAEAKAKAALEEAAKSDPALAATLKAKARAEEAAAASAEETPASDVPDVGPARAAASLEKPLGAETDSLGVATDSLGVLADSLGVAADSTVVELDTTKVGFVTGIGHVKVFRTDIQALCDSLEYNDLDSIARLYIEPMVWNETNRQYNSDSLFVLIKDGGVDRASLQSNAFIMVQEDSSAFDQIRGAQVMAYFDTTTALTRFDALGDANALFYLKEEDELATVNKVACKMLSATLTNGEVDRVYYYESPTNDAYPRVQLAASEREMKGFNWTPDLRPKGKQDITDLTLKESEREIYEAHPHAEFFQTDRYFPGYMASVYRSIEVRDSLRRLPPKTEEEIPAEELAEEETAAPAEETITPSEEAITPSEETVTPAEEAEAPSEESETPVEENVTSVEEAVTPAEETEATAEIPAEELDPEAAAKAAKEAEAAARAAEIAARRAAADSAIAARRAAADSVIAAKQALREQKWAVLDSLDSLKTAAKELKALEKKRVKTRKALAAKFKQDSKDRRKLERYIRIYERKKARKESRGADGGDSVFSDDGTDNDRYILSGGSLPGPESGPGVRSRDSDSDNSGWSDGRP